MFKNKLIEHAVQSFKQAEKEFIKTLSDKNVKEEDFGKTRVKLEEKRRTIKRLFKDDPSLEVDREEIRNEIRKIRTNEDIYGKLISKVQDLDNEDVVDYYGENWLIQLNEEYDLENFFLRRIEAGALILRKNPSKGIVRLFEILRECYATGNYEAAIVFCRAMVEQGVRENTEARKSFEKFLKKNSPKSDNLKNRIDNSPLGSLKEKAHTIDIMEKLLK